LAIGLAEIGDWRLTPGVRSGGESQHGRCCLAHHCWRGRYRVERPRHAKLDTARRVQRLVGAHGQQDHRPAVGQRADDAA